MNLHPRYLPALLVITMPALAACAAPNANMAGKPTPAIHQQELFTAGVDGYHTYRIPALIVTKAGTLLAFCEGRKDSRSDTGNIDILLRRSTDNGQTWGPVQLVADHGPDTIGNPCPVVDRETGTIWLLLTGNPGRDNEKQIKARTGSGTRTVWVAHSIDDGRTWTRPVEITADVKLKDWTWYATGPGCGIQLRSGRMVIPCDHNLVGKDHIRRSHVIYSDDRGQTWKIGGVAKEDVNECQLAELTDGTLMLNMRSYATGAGQKNRRAVSISRDAGLTWSKLSYAPELIEPICQAAFISFSPNGTPGRNALLFANPASTKRENMTVRLSQDDGKTWPVARPVWAGPSAYSALAVTPDHNIALFYERGDKNPYEKITLARFPLEWLTAGDGTPEAKAAQKTP